jgi:mxaK protein
LKRKHVHGGFAAVTLCLTVLTAGFWLELVESRAITRDLALIPASLTANVDSTSLTQTFRYPETRLARANALSQAGSYASAEMAFNELIGEYKFDAIGQAAQFNLANAYLRQAMHSEVTASRRRPMLELAKQRYRDLLHVIPGDWDARYNLERALRLAPENEEKLADEKGNPIKRVRVIVPDFKVKDLP